MQNQSPESSVADFPPGDNFGLRASIIYDDLSSGLRAKHCLDRVTQDLDLEPGFFDVRLWSFDLLSEPALRSATAREAGDFEIIIFSAHGCGEPTATVREWVLEWLAHRGKQPCALAILHDGRGKKSPGESLLLDYLSDIAKAGCMDLVYPFGETATRATDSAIWKIVNRTINAAPILESILDHRESYPHWGINE